MGRLRATLLGYAGIFNQIRWWALEGHRFQSRGDLELPPDRAKSGDMKAFLERYGFRFLRRADRFDVYRHPQSGISQRIPRDEATGGGYMERNYAWYCIRAVEAALRATGEMAPEK